MLTVVSRCDDAAGMDVILESLCRTSQIVSFGMYRYYVVGPPHQCVVAERIVKRHGSGGRTKNEHYYQRKIEGRNKSLKTEPPHS